MQLLTMQLLTILYFITFAGLAGNSPVIPDFFFSPGVVQGHMGGGMRGRKAGAKKMQPEKHRYQILIKPEKHKY